MVPILLPESESDPVFPVGMSPHNGVAPAANGTADTSICRPTSAWFTQSAFKVVPPVADPRKKVVEVVAPKLFPSAFTALHLSPNFPNPSAEALFPVTPYATCPDGHMSRN